MQPAKRIDPAEIKVTLSANGSCCELPLASPLTGLVLAQPMWHPEDAENLYATTGAALGSGSRKVADETGGARSRPDSYKSFQRTLLSDPSFVEALVERTPECIKVVAQDGTLLQMNSAGVGMCGAADPEQLLGQCTFDLIAEEFRADWIANHLRVCNGEQLVWEFDIIGFSGERRHMETHAVPVVLPSGETAQLALTRDVSERKRNEARGRLLTDEVSHRANNLLAVVQGMVRLTAASSVTDLKQSIEGRLSALANAHSLLAKTTWKGADLAKLVHEELAAFISGGSPRVRAQGPEVTLSPVGAQSLAMVIHELATNAVKYGALASEDGSVLLDWTLDDQTLALRWTEIGGPDGPLDSNRKGVGSRVIDANAAQLCGRATRRWTSLGLVFELTADRAIACGPIVRRPPARSA